MTARMPRPGRLAACSVLAWTLAAPSASSQVAEAQFWGASLASRHGWSASLQGDTIVAGSPGRHDNALGQATVYRRIGGVWTQTQTLVGSTTVKLGWFGWSTSLDGDAVAVGDWGESDGPLGAPGFARGAAFVFRRPDVASPFVEEARLQPLDVAEFDRFGSSLALDGDALAVSAPGADDAGDGSGAVYVFRNAGAWSQEARLVAPAGAAGDGFGDAVALAGDTLAIGAACADLAGHDAGSVHVWVHDGANWVLQDTLVSPDAARDDRFGAALSLQGDVLAVGVPRRDVAGVPNAGAVEVWRRTGTRWEREAVLSLPAPRILDNLGQSVALDAGRVLAGIPNADGSGPQSGGAALFVEQSGVWSPALEFASPTTDAADWFGWCVALDGASAVVGAPNRWTFSPTLNGQIVVFTAVPGASP